MPISIQEWSAEFHARWGDGENFVAGVGIIGEAACCRLCRARHNRHAFVVHRMTQWYREGINPEDRLPYLATYLGHRNVHSTIVYLTVTQELLRHASDRFRAAEPEVRKVILRIPDA